MTEPAPSILRQTDRDWALIAENEPFFGVLTQERFRRKNLTPEALAEFWRSGEVEIQYLVDVLKHHFGDFNSRSALDFGCGVGRLTRAMATVAEQVVGYDVAPAMLTEARRHTHHNTRYVAALDSETFDWINSIIVFQHIPPARGYPLLEDLLSRLQPGGVLSLQITFFRDTSAISTAISGVELASWDGDAMTLLRQRDDARRGEMHMYDYDLNKVIMFAMMRGLKQLFLEHTNHSGCHGVRLFGRRD